MIDVFSMTYTVHNTFTMYLFFANFIRKLNYDREISSELSKTLFYGAFKRPPFVSFMGIKCVISPDAYLVLSYLIATAHSMATVNLKKS